MLLFAVIRAAHANGSHHKLALDALMAARAPDAERWQRLFLKHAEAYLAGSKAPDDEFKDFKNHVLHVRDGFWGGAPERAQHWFATLIQHFRGSEWPQAVRAAGILSHYVVDPLQPLHTAQSDAESAVHRAIEWSISRSYDDLPRSGAVLAPALAAAATGPHWLANLLCAGAELANRHYESLILHYDLHKGVVDPPAGLDAQARVVIGQLIEQAIAVNAYVLDRAILEAGVEPPAVTLGMDTVLATLRIPRKLLLRRLADSEVRRAVEAMYDELMRTGRVDATLDEENRAVRIAYEAEVVATRQRPDPAQLFPAPARPAIAVSAKPPVTVARPMLATVPTISTSVPDHAVVPPPATEAKTPVQAQTPAQVRAPAQAQAPRTITESSPLEQAYGVGARLAERFGSFGITTVGQFMTADAAMLAASLNIRQIKPDDVRKLQDLARLCCTMPGLTGSQAHLLVAVGCRSRAALAEADPVVLHRTIAEWHAAAIARGGPPPPALPPAAAVADWVARAGAAMTDRQVA